MENTNPQVEVRRKVTITLTDRDFRRLKMFVIWSGKSQQEVIETDLVDLLDDFDERQGAGVLAERAIS